MASFIVSESSAPDAFGSSIPIKVQANSGPPVEISNYEWSGLLRSFDNDGEPVPLPEVDEETLQVIKRFLDVGDLTFNSTGLIEKTLRASKYMDIPYLRTCYESYCWGCDNKMHGYARCINKLAEDMTRFIAEEETTMTINQIAHHVHKWWMKDVFEPAIKRGESTFYWDIERVNKHIRYDMPHLSSLCPRVRASIHHLHTEGISH